MNGQRYLISSETIGIAAEDEIMELSPEELRRIYSNCLRKTGENES